MSFESICIRRVEIDGFKKIHHLVLTPENGVNLLYGKGRSGKTSLCEFFQFVLYGKESVRFAGGGKELASGRVELEADGQRLTLERTMENGEDRCALFETDTKTPVPFGSTPGEYLTGLDSDAFDIVTYFKQSRYETPLFKPKSSFLQAISNFSPETQNIYRDYLSLRDSLSEYQNEKKTGLLDQSVQRRAEIRQKLDLLPALREEEASVSKATEELIARLDENEKRCVLIKADMANFADDMKLSENKRNAKDLNAEILLKEKKLREKNYEVTTKIGKISREKTEALKDRYNALSIALTKLSEARNRFSAAEETLSFHHKIFTGNDNAEHFNAEEKKIRHSRALRTAFRILGVLFALLGVSAAILLNAFGFSLAETLALGGAGVLCSAALFVLSCVFTAKTRKTLEENGKESVTDLIRFAEMLRAHEKTAEVYREELKKSREDCDRKNEEAEEIRRELVALVSGIGGENDGDLLAACDEIIDANQAVFDLEDDIADAKEEYRRLLSENVEKTELKVSPKFAALEKELAFLTRQNDSLAKKKEQLAARLTELRGQMPDPALEGDLALLEEKIEKLYKSAEGIRLNLALAESRKDNFETRLKEILTEKINSKLAFFLKDSESFRFNENFELCFCGENSVIPLTALGGGTTTELGLFAFRLSLAELLKKNHLPMIFDETMALLDRETAAQVIRVIQASCGQIFLATSDPDLVKICADAAVTELSV